MFAFCFVAQGRLEDRDRVVIIKTVQKIYFSGRDSIEERRQYSSQTTEPSCPAFHALVHLAGDFHGILPRGTHTTCLRPAADNFVYTICIQRLLGSSLSKVNLFFKFLIFLRISRFIPRFAFGIGIALSSSQYIYYARTRRPGLTGNGGDL